MSADQKLPDDMKKPLPENEMNSSDDDSLTETETEGCLIDDSMFRIMNERLLKHYRERNAQSDGKMKNGG